MLRIYNTFSKQKEKFVPLESGKVKMYTCGPTVYDYIHLGNIRAYLMADIIRRYLEYSGYEVRHIKNITDVGHLTEDDVAQGDSGDDKLLKKAFKERKSPRAIADFYEEYFHQTENKMNILRAHYFPRATAHIRQMIVIIQTLLEKGYAYKKNGNVFFEVTKFPEYGRLSGNTLENLKVGARLEEHPDKKNPWDFALWLKAPAGHLLKWESPWSLGYPGWHIECSAMSTEYLGSTIDIHTGGEDNIFPHHEAEIAQTECATGKKFVKYWMHLRHLFVDGAKMSKSKGNFYKLEDIEARGYTPMELRLALLSSHYRGQFNFTWLVMDQAKSNLRKIKDWLNILKRIASKDQCMEGEKAVFLASARRNFMEAMDNDLNTSGALTAVYEIINETNRLVGLHKISADEARETLDFWEKINKVFGLVFLDEDEIPSGVRELMRQREIARQEKKWLVSDELREKIAQIGFLVEDTKDGQAVKKI